jgi:outer membrane receptor protein involved in Fe transport
MRLKRSRAGILASTTALALLLSVTAAAAAGRQAQPFTIPAQDLSSALKRYAIQADRQIVYSDVVGSGATSHTLVGEYTPEEALRVLLQGTRFGVATLPTGVIRIYRLPEAPAAQQAVKIPVRTELTVAAAEPAPPPPPPAAIVETAPEQVQEVVVTGSRIARTGFTAPTPLTVAPVEQVQLTTPSNIPDALNQLPVFAGSRNGAFNLTSGTSPQAGNYLNLRSIGIQRSLILLDGRRVPPTSFEGSIDTNTLPQLLVSQVEVVTGGASAVYGSDAVSGVVNFVLNKRFTGLKGVVQAGISDEGDANSWRAGIAGGRAFLDGRAHVIFSAEHYQSDGIKRNEERPYGDDAYALVGAGTRAAPFRLVSGARISNATWGGAVLTGPLAGRQFLPGGVLAPFNAGTPSGTTNIALGGDGGYFTDRTMLAPLRTDGLFLRGEYEVGGGITAFAQLGWNEARNRYSKALDTRPAGTANSITIFSGNAFLPAAAQQILTQNNTASFALSRLGREDPLPTVDMLTNSAHITAGLSGRVFETWKWDIYGVYGVGRLREATQNNTNNRRYYAAIDAVRDPAGNIVCRVTLTNPGLYPGCVPYNPFGEGAPSQAAIAYVLGTTQFDARNEQTNFAGNLTGELFKTWAGPIQVALGAEYRRNTLDLQGNVNANAGVDFTGLRGGFTTNTTEYSRPAVANTKGAANVWEVNAEGVVPLAKGMAFAEDLELNGAVRYTDYSTTGSVTTWKVGVNYAPVKDIRFRFTRSRDIRAPSIYELFAGAQLVQPAFNDIHTNTSGFPLQSSQGNPNLVPEIAKTLTAGVVYRPSFIEGLSLSVDYYDIVISNAIGTIPAATMVSQCESSGGTSPLCANIVRPLPFSDRTSANFPSRIINQNLNIAQLYTHGIDVEASYATDLDRLASGLPGRMNVRLLASYQPVLKSRPYAGATVIDAAGAANLSETRITLSGGYAVGNFSTDIQVRYLGPQKWSGDPTQFYDIPHLKAYTTVALNFGYKFVVDKKTFNAFLTINNVFDVNPPLFPQFGAILGALYPAPNGTDVIGRYITGGVRFQF